jgi:hypothetical protein
MHRGNRRSLPLGYGILSEGFVMVLLHGGSPKGWPNAAPPAGPTPATAPHILPLNLC